MPLSHPVANPVLVEITRGDCVESVHRGAAVVVDAKGTVLASWGDVARPVYARSAIKPLQALTLVESGAAERFALGDAELALACASHFGEAVHVGCVRRWLARIGLDEQQLECGAHAPRSRHAWTQLVRTGAPVTPAHNNCSGKHVGMLTTAVHLGEPTRGYISPDHPVQRRIRRMLEDMTDCDLSAAPVGVDGCGIPVVGISLAATALAMARFGAPSGLPAKRASAARRLRRAMARAPHMVAGEGGFCTIIVQRAGGGVLVKTGAEGVFTAVVPGRELGLALKIDDGAGRAAEVAVAALLAQWSALSPSVFDGWLVRPHTNVAGREVGVWRPAAEWSLR